MEQEVSTISLLLGELDNLIKNKMYVTALIETFILVDVCSKVEYPNIKRAHERFENWYYDYILKYLPEDILKDQPSLQQIYDIRCYLFHEGRILTKKNNELEKLNIKLELNDENKKMGAPYFYTNKVIDYNNVTEEKTYILNVPEYVNGMNNILKGFYKQKYTSKNNELPKIWINKTLNITEVNNRANNINN